VDIATGLFAVSPDVICTGDLMHMEGGSWTVRLKHFLTGDVHKIISFVDGFTREAAERKYILSNEIGDGRMLVAAPSLTKQSNGYSLICLIAPSVPRVDAQKIGSSIATDPETNDWILDAKGGVATVSGVDYLPQRVREVLSIQRNESPFYPTFGMRFLEYFEAFRGSPWLDLLFKLDVVRQASMPFNDTLTGQMQTPLQRVMRVRGLDLLADKPTKNCFLFASLSTCRASGFGHTTSLFTCRPLNRWPK
jgi:hypothetical protein